MFVNYRNSFFSFVWSYMAGCTSWEADEACGAWWND